ncbi:hypothetical protein GEMRC1_008873 [Eukaryota sp. GEM-RC1]
MMLQFNLFNFCQLLLLFFPDSTVTITSLSLSSSVVLFFQNNSTLTISDVLLLKGGTLRSDLSSSSSFTSVDSLVLEGDHVVLHSHKLIVNRHFVWNHGSIELDSLGELMFVDVINVTLKGSDPNADLNSFLYCSWFNSYNNIDRSGNHDPDTITIDGPEFKRDESGGYLDIKPGDTLHVPNIPGLTGWRWASISIWIYIQEGGFGFGHNGWRCTFFIESYRVRWGPNSTPYDFPLETWFHLVVTATDGTMRVYVNGKSVADNTPSNTQRYYCSSGGPAVLPLSEISPMSSSNVSFTGRIRAVQVFRKSLSAEEVGQLNYDPLTGILGEGKLSLVNSEVTLLSSKFDLRSITLTSSILQSNEATFDKLQSLQLFNHSLVIFTQGTTIVSENISITLNSSELYFDTSVDISSSTLSLIAINSHLRNEFDFSNVHVLDLSFSTFELMYDFEIIVHYFWCSQCQLIGNSQFVITEFSKINSGNFSSSLIVRSSVTNSSSVSGEVQLSDSFDFFSHVTFDDVSVSEFQSSSGSIACHSDVLMRNDVTFSFVTFSPSLDVVLSDSNVNLNQDFKLLNFQVLSGSGVVFDTTSNSGKIIPLPLIVFENDLVLSLSSTVSIEVVDTNTSTKIFVGSTVYLDGTLEVDFDPFKYWSGHEFLLVSSSNLIGEFTSVNSTCSSIFKIIYTSTSVLGSFEEYIAHLDQVSYVSATGIDDPCCGSFNTPCASFKGVLERMGRKGKVYFHEGSYSFNQGLGKISDVDWEVIGLGDVMIEGRDETLFEIDDSVFVLSNVSVNTSTCRTFHISNSSVSVNNSTFQSLNMFSDGVVFDSSFTVCSSSFTSFSFEIVITCDLSFSISSSSLVTMFTSTFDNLIVNSLIDSDSSSLIISHSVFSDIISNSIFNLNNSELTITNCDIFNTFGDFFIDGYESALILNYLDFKFSNFTQWFSIVAGSFDGQHLAFFDITHDVFYFNNCSEAILQNVRVDGSNIDSLINFESTNISILDFSIQDSVGVTLITGFDSDISLESLLISNTSFNSFVSISFSCLIAASIQSHLSIFIDKLLSFYNSTIIFKEFLVTNVSSNTFSSSFDSTVLLEDTVVRHFDFQIFLNLRQSNVTFNNLSKLIA